MTQNAKELVDAVINDQIKAEQTVEHKGEERKQKMEELLIVLRSLCEEFKERAEQKGVVLKFDFQQTSNLISIMVRKNPKTIMGRDFFGNAEKFITVASTPESFSSYNTDSRENSRDRISDHYNCYSGCKIGDVAKSFTKFVAENYFALKQ
jgi:hypothetical protein